MSDVNALLPLQRGIEIPDVWLNANATDPTAIWWIAHPGNNQPPYNLNSHTAPEFVPRGITIDGDNSGAGGALAPAATYAAVKGILWDETPPEAKTRYLGTHGNHARRYRGIYAMGTTARGIEIDG
jgi:hypothetical protein